VKASIGLDIQAPKRNTYALSNLLFDRKHDPVNAAPLILVLGPAADNTEAFEDVNNVIDATSFHL
jgi:hypothetical protein